MSADKVTKLLGQQKIRLQQMLDLLAEELNAVKDRNGEQMLAITKKKEIQLQAIRNADELLNQQDVIQLVAETNELGQLKSDVLALVKECQTKNEVIYLTATQNQIAIEQVKSLLLGGSKNATYDSKGIKHTKSTLGAGIKA
jgi:flagella synthesis protein FlgN